MLFDDVRVNDEETKKIDDEDEEEYHIQLLHEHGRLH
jgi:hypothetical protein